MFNEKTGYLVNLKVVADGDDVMIISDSGTIIRLHAADISLIGRNTQGVRIMRLKDAKVATVAVAPERGRGGEGGTPRKKFPRRAIRQGPAEAGEEPGDPQE